MKNPTPLLLPLTLIVAGCNPQDLQEFEAAASGAPTALSASMSTDYTNARISSLTEGAATLDPGAYPLVYERIIVTPGSNGTTVSQTSNPSNWEVGVTAHQWPAQSFTATSSGVLSKVSLLMSAGDTTDTVEVDLYSGGLPGTSGSVHLGASTAVLASSSGQGWVDFDYGAPVNVVDNDVYYILVKLTATTGANMMWGPSGAIWYMNTSHAYAGGATSVTTNSGISFIAMGEDTCFKVFVTGEAEVDTFSFSYNGISSATFDTYPAGQSIEIDGGRAGKLTFVPGNTAPASATETDIVTVIE
jgi:hypothetical protein